MRKKLLLLALFMLGAVPCFAQQVGTAWVRRYNGPGNSDDEASAIAVDGSGNVYVTGVSYGGSVTAGDYATIKYDSAGNQLWVQRYNGSGNSDDVARAIAVDGSGNVYVTGYSVGSGTSTDYATIKYDPAGNQLWVQRYNGPGNDADEASAISVDSSGNVYVTGYSEVSRQNHDYATIKYDPAGNQLWVKTYNSPGIATAISVDGSGNVYVTGRSIGIETQYDYATLKYDPAGNQLWVQRYNGPGNLSDEASALAVDSSGNVYVTGRSIYTGTSYDYGTLKYDPSGNQLWVQKYTGPGNSDDEATAISVDGSGNVYVTGRSIGSETSNDYATLKYDPAGTQLWVQRYNGPGNDADEASAIAVDGSGNVYVTGYSYGSGTSNDYATIRYWQNYPPDSFSLLSPTQDAIILYNVGSTRIVNYDWETATDPDPWDTAEYDLYVSTSPAFHSDSTLIYDSLLTSQYTDTLEMGRYYWKVKAYDKHSEVWSNQTWTLSYAIRGDANADKKVSVADVVYLINFLFRSGPAPNPFQTGDVNCDGYVTVADVVYLVNYLFKGGPPPAS